MIKVKTFTGEIRVFHTMNELHALDDKVNLFIQENNIKKVISVSDTSTQGEGVSCGIIRVLTYEE